jgi:hypothetical protein
MKIPENSLVIGRYSVLPFYHELASDLQEVGSRLINSPLEHSFISRFDWYHQIAGLTPRTWFDTTEAFLAFDSLPHGMILKGRTNSAKNWEWMYAKTKEDFWRIDKFLHQHEMIANQGIVYREYVPLEILEKTTIPGAFNFVNEWRCFFYQDLLLECGYYWTMAQEETIRNAKRSGALTIATEAAKLLAEKTNFFVVDVAKTAEGRWIVIEVNDGQMSGLSCCNPDTLYKNLKKAVDKHANF